MSRPAPLRLSKRSLAIAGHRTSVSLEDEFWQALGLLAAQQNTPLAALVARIDGERGVANLSSAIRVHVLRAALAGGLARPVQSAA